MLQNDAFIQASELDPSDFSLDAHRRIFARMVELSISARAIDLVTITDELDARKELSSVGGPAYIAGLIDGLPDRPRLKATLALFARNQRLRKIIHSCTATIARAQEGMDNDTF